MSIGLYDCTGKLIRNLYRGKGEQGLNRIAVDISGISNGLYFVRLQAEAYKATQKLVVHR